MQLAQQENGVEGREDSGGQQRDEDGAVGDERALTRGIAGFRPC